MAFPSGGTPVLTRDTTTTSGTGTLTLANNTGTGYRTPKEANTAGDFPSGSTASYEIYDSTRAGSHPKLLEKGSGVWTDSGGGGTLTRPPGNVRQPAGGIISLDGNQVDVLIVTDPLERDANGADIADPNAFAAALSAAQTTAANTFTLNQTIDTSGFQASLKVRSDLSTGGPAGVTLAGHDSGGANQDYTSWATVIENNAPGAEAAQHRWYCAVAGVLTERLRLQSDGTLSIGTGDDYVHLASGDTMLFRGAPPAQFARVNAAAGTALKLAATGDTPGATGGTLNPFATWATSGHVLTVAEMAAHTHTGATGQILVSSVTGVLASPGAGSDIDTDSVTGSTGSNSSHSHNIQAIKYEIAVWGSFI